MDSNDPIRRELLLTSIEEEIIEPETNDILRAFDIFIRLFQSANFKGKPKSILTKKRKKTVKTEQVYENGKFKPYKVVG
jgi:hypothetical protein